MPFRSIAIWTGFKIENTEDIDFPDPKPNAVNSNETTSQLARNSSTGPPTQEARSNHSTRNPLHRGPLIGPPRLLQITHE